MPSAEVAEEEVRAMPERRDAGAWLIDAAALQRDASATRSADGKPIAPDDTNAMPIESSGARGCGARARAAARRPPRSRARRRRFRAARAAPWTIPSDPHGSRARTRCLRVGLQRSERTREDVLGAVAERVDARRRASGSRRRRATTITKAAPPAASETKPIGRITSRSAATASGPQKPLGRCTASIGLARHVAGRAGSASTLGTGGLGRGLGGAPRRLGHRARRPRPRLVGAHAGAAIADERERRDRAANASAIEVRTVMMSSPSARAVYQSCDADQALASAGRALW